MKETFPIASKDSSEKSTNQDRFNGINESTLCPFAQKSKIEFAPEWNENQTFEDNIAIVALKLKQFTNDLESSGSDGFVVEAKGEEYSKDLEALSSFLRRTLRELQKLDTNSNYPMDKNIGDENWQFSFNKTNLFLIVFAPFYSENNPRYSHTTNSVFIFFQPDSSFNAHIVNPADHPRTKKLKQNIRESFDASGKSYDHAIVDSPFEATKYIKPLHVGDTEVRWWEESQNKNNQA